jgi:hypothetical protein
MLPAQRKALGARVVAGVVVASVAFLVARWMRGMFFEKEILVAGENGMRHWEAARASFARGDAFPLWDRTTCGGGPGLADPESLALSSLVAGVFQIHGDQMARWVPTLAMTLGIVGAYLWCRSALSIGRVGSLFAGVVFATSGFLSLQASQRMMFTPLLFMPWVLYFAHLGEEDERYGALVAVVLAIMVLEGGMLALVESTIALLLVSAPRLFDRRRGPLPVLRMLGVAAVGFVLHAGVKLIPVAITMARWPSHPTGGDQLKWPELFPIFIDKDRFDALAGHRFHFNEYRAYVGPLALGAAIAGAGVALLLKPRRIGLVVMLLGGLLLTRGAYSETSPYSLLLQLLPWNALIVPSRFVVIAVLGIGAAGAVAIDRGLELVARHKGIALVLVAVAIVGAWDPVYESRKMLKAQGTEPWLPRPDPPSHPYSIGEDPHRLVELPARNVGFPGCERLLEEPFGKTPALGPKPQAWVDGPDVGSVANIDVKQNGYTLRATMARAGVVHINTSWDPDWSASAGKIVRTPAGMLDLALPAGATDVVLRYRPAGFVAGAMMTTTGILGLAAMWLWPLLSRRKKKPDAKATAKPPTPPAVTPTPEPDSKLAA